MKDWLWGGVMALLVTAVIIAIAYGIAMFAEHIDKNTQKINEKAWKVYEDRTKEYKEWCDSVGGRVQWDDRKRYTGCK